MVVNRRVRDGTATSAEEAAWRRWMRLVPGSSSSSRKKKKKKRKRKLPKSSSGVRLRRCGQRFCSRSSVSGAQCSLLLTTGPRCSTSWPVRNRSTATCSSCARLVFLAISNLALCFLPCLQARDARHHGRRGPRDSYVEVHRCSSWTRSLIFLLVCYEWRHDPDSAENCLAIPQVQLIITVVVFPFRCAVAVPHGPLRQQIIEIPLLLVFGGRCPCLQVHFTVVVQRQISWSRLYVGPFSSPEHGGRCPCCAGRACHTCCCQR